MAALKNRHSVITHRLSQWPTCLNCESRTLTAQKFEQLQDIASIKQALHYKLGIGKRLNPVEAHLAKCFASLQHNLFAPSLITTLIDSLWGALRPAAGIIVGILAIGTIGLYNSQRQSELGLEKFAEAQSLDQADVSNQANLTEVALDLADKQLSSSNVQDSIKLSALSLPSLPTSFPWKTSFSSKQKNPKPKLQAINRGDLRTQRNLLKFISGIIAAFRPSIKDSGKISRYIVELASAEQVDPIYVAAVIAIESRFSSTAQSGAGAMGLMQLLPATAKEVANSDHHRTAHLNDPRTNIRLGISYLKQLEQRFKGNRFLALAAYNWGPGNMDKVAQHKKRIPRSVRGYATTVLERTLAWRRHFDRATENAEALQTAQNTDNKAAS